MTEQVLTAPTIPQTRAVYIRGATMRAIYIIWKRDLIRYWRDRMRVVASLAQPVLFLFVFGSGLSSSLRGSTGGFGGPGSSLQYVQFIFPGIIGMSVLFTSIFGAMSIVWDREFGFLREMMVAPVRRSSLVIGKCLGGATVAAFEGVILICLAGLVGVPYAPILILEIFGLQLLVAFSITAFGVMAAARVKQMQSFMALTQMVIMPMYFLSGALFPVSGLPQWLAILNRIDPLTYAVDPMRRAVFAHLNISPVARRILDPGVTWFGWHLPGLFEAGVVALLGLLMLGIAIFEFSRIE
jgi:ABC-2 type transport system permease protein